MILEGRHSSHLSKFSVLVEEDLLLSFAVTRNFILFSNKACGENS